MPELDQGAFLPPPPYDLSSRNTPHNLGLNTSKHFSNWITCEKVKIKRYLNTFDRVSRPWLFLK